MPDLSAPQPHCPPLAPLQGLQALLGRLRIRTRIAALMLLAVAVAALLAFLGVHALQASKESLRTVYEQRMQPVRNLSRIAQLMLSNQMHMQQALAQARELGQSLERESAQAAAGAIEDNARIIDTLWFAYQSHIEQGEEKILAERFGQRRGVYLRQALYPAVAALRALDYSDTERLSHEARRLYELAYPDIQALIALQFDAAAQAYQQGEARYERTGYAALLGLLAALLLLGYLGLLLMRTIQQPLLQVIALCQRIAHGHLDNAIPAQQRDEMGDVFGALHAMQGQLRESAQAIHQLAYYDTLTQLPNRALLRQRLQEALAPQNLRSHGVLMLIDLDNFKTVNDTLGHEVGDRLLQEVAARLHDAVHGTALVARLGGDEFVVLARHLHPDTEQARAQAGSLAQRIVLAVAQPLALAERVLHPSASVGLCMFVPATISDKELLKRADTAMYQAKEAGRNVWRFFDPVLQARMEMRSMLEVELRGAVAGGELTLHYQAQVDSQQRPLGAEALLRWNHPVHGPVSPAEFIAIAENSDLILELGKWVLHAACQQLADWGQDPRLQSLTLSINVSARQFAAPQFVSQVHAALGRSGACAGRLILELTESMVLQDMNETVEKMQQLQALGVRFALDDFGTGYSNLAQLQRLPLYQLKIDRSFVRDLGRHTTDAVIAQTIIGMARNLGLDIVAEGVENKEQLDVLTALDCPVFQGYLFAVPQPAGAFQTWLLRHNHSPIACTSAPVPTPVAAGQLSIVPPPQPPALAHDHRRSA